MTDLAEIAHEMMASLDDSEDVQAVIILRRGSATRSQLWGFDMEEDPMAPAVWLLSNAMHIARANGKQVVAFRLKGEQ